MRRWLSIGLMALALPLSACGGGGDDDGSTTTSPRSTTTASAIVAGPREQAAASRAVLRLSDLPAGWRRSDDDDAAAAARCLDAVGTGRQTARAQAPTFEEGQRKAVSVTSLYATPGAADTVSAGLRRGPVRRCLQRELARRLDEADDDVRIGKVTIARRALSQVGDRTEGLRVRVPARTEGITIPVYVDLTMLREGRAVSLLVTANVLLPFDADLHGRLIGVLDRRLRAAAGR